MVSLVATKEAKATAVLSKGTPRRGLFQELTTFQDSWDARTQLLDIVQLVQDQSVSRTDLRMILLDDEVHQAIGTRVDAVVNVDWRLEDQQGSPDQLSFLTEELTKFYQELITNSFNAVLFGYDVQERIYDYNDEGRVVVDRLISKPFEWFRVDHHKHLFFTPRGFFGTEGQLVDTQYKFLLTLNKPTYKNPRGEALLAWAFWPWFYRSVTWQFWMQFLERAGSPLLVGTGNDPTAIAEALALAYQDAVIGVPTGATVEAVSSNNRGESFAVAEDRLVRRIQKLILGQTLTSDIGPTGNGAKALGSVHNEVRQEKTIADIKLVGKTAQNFVDALSKINFPGLPVPKVIYDIDRGLELPRAGRDAILLNTGTVKLTKQYFIRNYGFEQDELEIIDKEEATAASNADKAEEDPKDADVEKEEEEENAK